MALSGIKWLGSQIGVDITGQTPVEESLDAPPAGWMDKFGNALFQTESENSIGRDPQSLRGSGYAAESDDVEGGARRTSWFEKNTASPRRVDNIECDLVADRNVIS
eukprot:TRINITY_DN1170_c0_g1_i1.p2 TRINITY_DN1170_c0_g1~~TRINITY_DN1170_c0_g1_i1.p2  ORF type:complete len:124 (+),score=52.11 TRINITY_DN1170_c0_g1_i1:56-373(+)